MSIAEWARQALALVLRNDASGSVDRKLEAIRTAVKYEFPTADIDQMLAEIECGYTRNPIRESMGRTRGE